MTTIRKFLALLCTAGALLPFAKGMQVPLYSLEAVSIGENAKAVTSGDFDGDGRMDCAVAISGFGPANGIVVLLNRGTSGWSTQTYAAPSTLQIHDLESSDLTGDGRPELLLTAGGMLVVFVNSGLGAFPTLTSNSAGAYAGDLAVGDMNEDGKSDVLVCNFTDHKIVMFLGDGAGGFTSSMDLLFAVGVGTSVVIGELSGDSHLDLAVGLWSAAKGVQLLIGNGNGGFTNGALLDTTAYDAAVVALSDIDSDGRADLVCRLFPGGSSQVFAIFRSTSHGFQAGVYFAMLAASQALRLADVNLDGHPDAIECASDSVRVHPGTGLPGAAMFAAPIVTLIDHGLLDLAPVDVQGDGFVDLLIPDRAGDTLLVLAGNGGLSFPTVPAFPVHGSPRHLVNGDVDNDGDADIITANLFSDDISVFLNDGNGGLAAPSQYSTSPSSRPMHAAIGDLNGDGKLDVAVTNGLNGGTWHDVSVLFGNGVGAFGGLTHVAPGAFPNSVEIEDLDGDGDPDLLVSCNTAGSVALIWNDGTGHFGAPTLLPLGIGAVEMATDDFNHDGKRDIVVASGSGSVAVLLGTGLGSFANPLLLQTSLIGIGDVDVGQLNADSHPDIVCCDGHSSRTAVLFGNGAGGFSSPAIQNHAVVSGGVANGVDIDDVDGDGNHDLVVGALTGLTVLAGDGLGGFAPRRVFWPLDFKGRGSVCDLNGDGALDVVTLRLEVSVLLNHVGSCESVSYCVPKLNSQGCLPTISSDGCASATNAGTFTIRCSNAINNKRGLLIYGTNGPQSLPFSGGTLCVNAPVSRTPPVDAAGTPPPLADCSGAFAMDFNAFIAGGTGSALLQVPGTAVHSQWWGRDPVHPSVFKTQLSNALSFVIRP